MQRLGEAAVVDVPVGDIEPVRDLDLVAFVPRTRVVLGQLDRPDVGTVEVAPDGRAAALHLGPGQLHLLEAAVTACHRRPGRWLAVVGDSGQPGSSAHDHEYGCDHAADGDESAATVDPAVALPHQLGRVQGAIRIAFGGFVEQLSQIMHQGVSSPINAAASARPYSSKMSRRVESPRAVWLLTVPGSHPIASAVSLTENCSK